LIRKLIYIAQQNSEWYIIIQKTSDARKATCRKRSCEIS